MRCSEDGSVEHLVNHSVTPVDLVHSGMAVIFPGVSSKELLSSRVHL